MLKVKTRSVVNFRFDAIKGINGAGKTTYLKNIITEENINNYLYFVHVYEKKKYICELLDYFEINNIPFFIESCKQLGLNLKYNVQMQHYSSGEKKKIYLSMLLNKKNYVWYIDEPKNYLDDLAFLIFVHKLRHQVTSGGNIIFSNNDGKVNITKHTDISLSRFELLTYRLSSECSTAEL